VPNPPGIFAVNRQRFYDEYLVQMRGKRTRMQVGEIESLEGREWRIGEGKKWRNEVE